MSERRINQESKTIVEELGKLELAPNLPPQETSIETQEQFTDMMRTAVGSLERSGIPEAEKIAAEFGVEVDDQTRLELERLNAQARQVEEFYKSSWKNRFLNLRSKALNKILPDTGLASLATITADMPFREYLEKRLRAYSENPPENLEDLINIFANYYRINQQEDNVNFQNILLNYLLKVDREEGIDRTIKAYKKVPAEFFKGDFSEDLAEFLLQQAYEDLTGQVIYGESSEAFINNLPSLLIKLKGATEIILNAQGFLADLHLSDEVLGSLINQSTNSPAGHWGVIRGARYLKDQKSDPKISEKKFEAFLDLMPSELLLYRQFIFKFNKLPESVRAEKLLIILKQRPSAIAKNLKLLDIPPSIRDQVWPEMKETVLNFVDLAKNQKSWEDLGVTKTMLMDKVIEGKSYIPEMLGLLNTKEITSYGYTQEDKNYALAKIANSIDPRDLFDYQGVWKCFTPEQLNHAVYKVLHSWSTKFRDLSALSSNLDAILLDNESKELLIDKMLKSHLNHPYLITALSRLGLPQERNFSILKKMLETDSVDVISAIRNLLTQHSDTISPEHKQWLIDRIAWESPHLMISSYKDWNLSEEENKRVAQIMYGAAMVLNTDNKSKLAILESIWDNTHEKIVFDYALEIHIKAFLGTIEPSKYLEAIDILADAMPEEVDLLETTPAQIYQRLEKFQARSANQEYDPWVTDLDPLLRRKAGQDKLLDLENLADGQILLDYVREYGMSNLPTLFRWHVYISRANKIESVPYEIINEIEQELNLHLIDLENKGQIVSEIQNFKHRIQEVLLRDEIPPELLRGKLGPEIFGMLKGSTRWKQDDSLADLISKWKRFSKNNPEQSRVPQGYEEVSFAVPSLVRRSLSETESNQLVRKENEILTNRQLKETVTAWSENFLLGEHIGNESKEKRSEKLLSSWIGIKEEIIDYLNGEKIVINLKLKNEQNPPARAGMEKQLETIDHNIEVVSSYPGSDNLTELLENLVKIIPKKYPNRDAVLRSFSLAQMVELQPGPAQALKDRLSVEFGELTDDKLFAWSEYLVDTINEHYLHQEQVETHTKHAPFSKELLKELQFIYGIKPDFKKNLIVQSKEKLSGLRNEGVESTTKTVEISLVPAKGLLRIFSGDIGDACYTSLHDRLAQGDYENITAYTYVTGRGTSNERLRGSVLAIETVTTEGEKVLLIRANNPQENLLGQVDNNKLIEQTLNAMRGLASKRGITKVVVPRDQSSAACSNRKSVAKYYQRVLFGKEPTGLEDSPETNFNGYDVWNADGKHPCVEI